MGEDTKHIKDWDKRLMEQQNRGWDNYVRRRLHLDVARDLEFWGVCGEFFYVEARSDAAAVGEIRVNRNTNDAIGLDLGTVIKTIFCQVYITHAAIQGGWIDVIYGINFEYYKEQPVTVGAPVGGALAALQLPDGHNVTVDNAAGAAAVNIQDGGNSITVDAAALPLPAGAATAALQLADGHNVTVDNAAGAAAVNIQDGGNTITVDGDVTVDEGEAQPAIIITNVAADANTVGAAHACNRVLIRAFTVNTGLVWVDFNNAAVENACYPLDAGDAISVPLSNTNLINCLFKVAGEDVSVIYTV